MRSPSPRTCIIINPNAGSSEQMDTLRGELEAQGIACRETQREGHGRELAQEAADEGFERIVAAGGDGTLNEIINGLMEGDHSMTLGLIPLGTGNDLARTLCIPLAVPDALAVLESGQEVPLDLICVESGDEATYAANASAGGFSGVIGETMTSDLKSTWGPLAYVFGAAAALDEWQNYETFITFDDGDEARVDAFNVFVMNGQSVAGGKTVAPDADPTDGVLDVVIAMGDSRLDVAALAARFVAGTHLESPDVQCRRARRVHVRSNPGMLFNVDGELLTEEPVTFSVVPKALRVLAGPDFKRR